jgi:hypothetical protein
MAAKKQIEEEADVGAVIEPRVPDNQPNDYVKLINLGRTGVQIPLRDGSPSVNLGPMLPGRDLHVSGPVLKKLLPQAVRNMIKRGQIAVQPVE